MAQDVVRGRGRRSGAGGDALLRLTMHTMCRGVGVGRRDPTACRASPRAGEAGGWRTHSDGRGHRSLTEAVMEKSRHLLEPPPLPRHTGGSGLISVLSRRLREVIGSESRRGKWRGGRPVSVTRGANDRAACPAHTSHTHENPDDETTTTTR